MSKILIITDSLGLPRLSPQKVLYEETYPFLLRLDGHNVAQCSLGGGTSKDLYRQSLYYRTFYPDYVVIQSGIVDCAPRALRLTEQYIINSNPITRKLFGVILPHISRYLRKYRNLTYMKPSKYKFYINEMVKSFPNTKIAFVGILPPKTEYVRKVPKIDLRIFQYNNILKEVAGTSFLDTSSIPPNGIQSDFHHLTSSGHMFIYRKIQDWMGMDDNHNNF